MRAGNYRRGEARKSSKLTDDKVRAIRAAYVTPCACCGHKRSLAEIGAEHGVSAVAILKVVRGESWTHVQ
jgi:hypothetical protein